jgi:hypothetical protein
VGVGVSVGIGVSVAVEVGGVNVGEDDGVGLVLLWQALKSVNDINIVKKECEGYIKPARIQKFNPLRVSVWIVIKIIGQGQVIILRPPPRTGSGLAKTAYLLFIPN